MELYRNSVQTLTIRACCTGNYHVMRFVPTCTPSVPGIGCILHCGTQIFSKCIICSCKYLIEQIGFDLVLHIQSKSQLSLRQTTTLHKKHANFYILNQIDTL